MRNVTIVESNVEPNKEHLWFYNGKLKWFGPNGWEEINPQVLSPTTTPKPVVTTTTTTSTPVPTTTTTTTTTTSTTSSTPGPPAFKLINNTGGPLNVKGVGYIVDGIGTDIPPIPNGGSIFLLKGSGYNAYVYLTSSFYSNLSITVDGVYRDGLEIVGSNSYRIPNSIFSDANEITVYATSEITTTSTVKPNVK